MEKLQELVLTLSGIWKRFLKPLKLVENVCHAYEAEAWKN